MSDQIVATNSLGTADDITSRQAGEPLSPINGAGVEATGFVNPNEASENIPNDGLRGTKWYDRVDENKQYVYGSVGVLSVVVLAMTASAVQYVNAHKASEDPYSSFKQLIFLLVTAVINLAALFFLWSKSKEHYWAERLEYRYDLTTTLFGHVIPLVLWFCGAIALAVWVGKGIYCADPNKKNCKSLTTGSIAADGFTIFFSFVQVALLTIPTITAVLSSKNEWAIMHPARNRTVPALASQV